MIACLPMYDWPEVRAETDSVWAALAAAFGEAGFDAPAALVRDADIWSLWRAPDLLLGQTCGLPYAAKLRGDVSLVGTPNYDLPGCPAGMYRSEIIVRADDPIADLASCHGRRFAFNMRESQSGWAALDAVTPIGELTGALVETGAHRASLLAVADGRADFAALDAVSWRLAQAHDPAAAQVRVLTSTPPTPGLPLITAKRSSGEINQIAAVIEGVFHALPGHVRRSLFLKGLTRWRETDYAPLARGWPRNS